MPEMKKPARDNDKKRAKAAEARREQQLAAAHKKYGTTPAKHGSDKAA